MMRLGKFKGITSPCTLKRVTEELPIVSAPGSTVKSAESVWCFLSGVPPFTSDTISLPGLQLKLPSRVNVIRRCQAAGAERDHRRALLPSGGGSTQIHLPFLSISLFSTACGMILQSSLSCFTHKPDLDQEARETALSALVYP